MEDIYNDTYENLLKRYFVQPLKMKDTYLLESGKLPSKMAKGYDAKGV